MERITLLESETQLVVALITALVAPCSLFAFGYRNTTASVNQMLADTDGSVTHHYYYLLVFSKKVFQHDAATIANAIAERSHNTITASVLLHNVTDLGTKQASMQCFFDHVLRHGHRLLLDTTAPPYVLNTRPIRDVVADTAYWHKCVAVAQFNLQAAADSAHLEVTLCKIALLHTASVQVALGLIRVFLGYTPKEFGLKYLLQLCGHFTALPEQVFCQLTPEASKRFKMLCAPPSMLFHWTRLNAAEADFVWLLDACTTFVTLGSALALSELDRLEN